MKAYLIEIQTMRHIFTTISIAESEDMAIALVAVKIHKQKKLQKLNYRTGEFEVIEVKGLYKINGIKRVITYNKPGEGEFVKENEQ